jgi:predicted transposase YdaD
MLVAANEERVQEVLNMANMAKIDRVFKRLGIVERYEARGELKGKALGEIKGKKEKALEIAGNLKKIGLPLEQIAASTGLTAKQIKGL